MANIQENKSRHELIVIVNPEIELRATREGVTSARGENITSLSNFLKSEKIILKPLFGLSEERIKHRTNSITFAEDGEVPNLSVYYLVKAPEQNLENLANSFRSLKEIKAAYVKPISKPPIVTGIQSDFNKMLPNLKKPPVITPNFISRQRYLDPAPIGIDAKYAWTIPGGKGAGVKIIDCEWGWRFNHEDLTHNQSGIVVGVGSTKDNHGTAVIGIISGDENSIGITGICPDAFIGAASFVNKPSCQTIREAADRLDPGDILLLEIHREGPNSNGDGNDQKGFIPIEWWPDDFDAICYAVSKGVIVVEAAGNGWEDLDDPIYEERPHFPPEYKNPFNLNNRSSGAIIVGAGSPPAGTHGRNQSQWNLPYVDRARCGFSNYGKRVDVQGWGWEVTSTGYGDLQGGANKDEWYTDTFGGTSSASPIVVGALGCVQGILKYRGNPPLTPARARKLLLTTGSPQQEAINRPVTQRIGNRPNLKQLITSLDGCSMVPGQYKVIARPGLRLRAGPSIDFDIIGLIPFQSQVFLGKRKGDWVEIDFKGDGFVDGWAFASFLCPLDVAQ